MENVIEVQGLTKRYREKTAVDDLSFEVHRGEILGLLGPNGSGKSTTINCILSLLKYQGGVIRVFGREMRPDSRDLKAQIGVIFQDVAVFDELNVQDNIDYFCGLYITDKKTRREYCEDAIRFTGLEDYRKYRPKKLSGGLLRRLNIACSIAHKPKLLFADEPTVAVDPQSRNRILDGFRELRDSGVTIVYTTHYMEEAELLCDRVIILDLGKIIASGTVSELKALVRKEEEAQGAVLDESELTLNDVFLKLTGKDLRD
ncbi:MAG: ABC transporter ATP-binding protein [Anaerovoracaceae bacterium]|jgi:ABC-2 type transport system ATP-binding protein